MHVTEVEDLLNSNLLKRQQELTKRLQQADVEADRSDTLSLHHYAALVLHDVLTFFLALAYANMGSVV